MIELFRLKDSQGEGAWKYIVEAVLAFYLLNSSELMKYTGCSIYEVVVGYKDSTD